MLFVALAWDYDGTIAADGKVDQFTLDALAQVAENGAVLYLPKTLEERPIAAPPPPEFISALREKSVAPLSVGHCIVATWTPNEDKVLQCIRELGLDWQLIFNKGAVMSLPPGVNKASEALAAVHSLIVVGDAATEVLASYVEALGGAVPSELRNRAIGRSSIGKDLSGRTHQCRPRRYVVMKENP